MNATKNTINLSNDEALLLQQISENGEDDIAGLASGLRMSRRRVAQQIERLKEKKLVTIKASYDDLWVRASRRGSQLVHYLWPEMVTAY